MVLTGKNFGLLLALALLCVCALAQATTTIETVPVGDVGNQADTRYVSPGTGSVWYAYYIGKYEVTAGQYTAFLNAVAADDTYGLYKTNMWSNSEGCRIERLGSPGSYTYSVADEWANRPVNYVSFWDSVRFANWLHNGQPTGAQGPSTTEDGAYLINGYTGGDGRWVQRKPGWRWAVTSEDEWYKAAYYKGHATDSGYYRFPTNTDEIPGRDLNDPNGNNANYYGLPYPIDNGKYTTVVGQFRNTPSPYGTFDQGGNVWEWNERTLLSLIPTDPNTCRCIHGGGFAPSGCSDGDDDLLASFNVGYGPASEYAHGGFRVVRAHDGPKITSVTPNLAAANTTTTFRVLGQNFGTAATVRLTQQGQSDLVPSLTYVSPTEIGCTLDLTNATAGGQWNVVVTDAVGARDTLANGYTISTTVSPVRHVPDAASVSTDSIVTFVVSTSQFYVESDDRSGGILVGKTGHGVSVGQRVRVTGTARTYATGERCIAATALTTTGAGTIKPIVLSNKAIGGDAWFYDSLTGAGQKGLMEYRWVDSGGTPTLQLLDCHGMNNIGLLITTFGRVTYSTTGYFYIDDGSGCRDNSAYTGVKVLGAVPGSNPVGKYVKVTGVVSCFKGISPDASLYRQVRAREVTVIQ